jgi:hypothetical protein
MTRGPESRFIARVNRRLPDGVYYEKMANPYRRGTADNWYSMKGGGDLWVEYKYLPKLPKRAMVHPEKLLSPQQLKWLNDRHDEGRSVAVVIGCPEGGVLLTNRKWNTPITAGDFAANVHPLDRLAHCLVVWMGV